MRKTELYSEARSVWFISGQNLQLLCSFFLLELLCSFIIFVERCWVIWWSFSESCGKTRRRSFIGETTVELQIKLPRRHLWTNKSCFVPAHLLFRAEKWGRLIVLQSIRHRPSTEEYWSLLSNRSGGNKNRLWTGRRWVQLCNRGSTWELAQLWSRYVCNAALPQAWRGAGLFYQQATELKTMIWMWARVGSF